MLVNYAVSNNLLPGAAKVGYRLPDDSSSLLGTMGLITTIIAVINLNAGLIAFAIGTAILAVFEIIQRRRDKRRD